MKTDEIILASDRDGLPVLRMYQSSAAQGRRVYTEHHHTQLEISAVLSGSCEWQVRRRPFRCQRGDIVILGSDEEHYITSVDGGEELRLLNLQFEPRYIWTPGENSFDASYLGIFLDHDADFPNLLSGAEPAARQVFGLLNDMYAESRERRSEYPLVVKAELMLILALLRREYSGRLRDPAPRTIPWLDRLDESMSFIHAHLAEPLTLEDIAAAAGLSRSYYSALFKRLNGVPVWSYVTGKRIELAMRLLRETDMSVLETAGASGFNNLANFNRSFRLAVGASPAEYRRAHRQGETYFSLGP